LHGADVIKAGYTEKTTGATCVASRIESTRGDKRNDAKNKKDISNTNTVSPLIQKILNKVTPDWSRNREMKRIAQKLAGIPEIMEYVNDVDKLGIRKVAAKYLSADEQQYLNQLTRNSIKSAAGNIKEVSSSSIKKDYPYVIKYDNNKMGSKLQWNLISSEEMNKNEIARFQAAAGYSPQGYGGPFDFKEEVLPDTIFKYKWSCFSSSD